MRCKNAPFLCNTTRYQEALVNKPNMLVTSKRIKYISEKQKPN